MWMAIEAAAYVAGGLKARDKVIFVTDVNGLILNGKLVNSMTLNQAKSALPKIGSGMDKKVLACIEALEMGVKEAVIASGQVENPCLTAMTHRNCAVIGSILNDEDRHLATLYQRFPSKYCKGQGAWCGIMQARNTLTVWAVMELLWLALQRQSGKCNQKAGRNTHYGPYVHIQ